MGSRFRVLILLTLALGCAAPARAQFFYDEDTAAGYWMLERQRQQRLFERARPARQTPARLVPHSPPKQSARSTDKDPPEPEVFDPNDQRPRIAVLGDDLGDDLMDGLKALSAERGIYHPLRRTKDTASLARDDMRDWTKAARETQNGTEKIALAVILLGNNDRQPIRDGKTNQDVRSPRWKEIYAGRARLLGETFRDLKIPLVWVGLPITGNDKASTDFAQMNDLFKLAAQETGASFVDVWEAFADERGHFSPYGPDINGQLVRLRTSDGTHFTRAGAKKLAHFVDGEIARLLGENTPRDMTRALPAPSAPAQKGRPLIGPVMSLTAPPRSPGGNLMSAPEHESNTDLDAIFTRGLTAEPKSGRADDFSWP